MRANKFIIMAATAGLIASSGAAFGAGGNGGTAEQANPNAMPPSSVVPPSTPTGTAGISHRFVAHGQQVKKLNGQPGVGSSSTPGRSKSPVASQG